MQVPVMEKSIAKELKKLRAEEITIIPVLIRALGTTPKILSERLKEIGIENCIDNLQESAVL